MVSVVEQVRCSVGGNLRIVAEKDGMKFTSGHSIARGFSATYEVSRPDTIAA